MNWLADECFDNDIVRGLFRRAPQLDLIRVQDLPGVAGCDDKDLLAWAAQNDRILLTHDVSTMIPALQHQFGAGVTRTRIVLVPDSMPVIDAIREILLLDQCSVAADWLPGVVYLPLQ